ncbi:hypothetical protein [Afipia sp. GAS231]|uniref:hypothetical protein n=1 Tax=Afipia sp. GAS231 TaxID=1882747 RepID=UPI00087D30E0|nr:hypothetical protein [Afipia sp. GAS231]SDO80126.1 hypothetical protein SAMN05444050_5045 [Afipia sp. GAS231]
MIRRLIVPLTVAVATFHAGHAFAQGAFPAPLPNGQMAPPAASSPANDSAFTRGAAPVSGPGFGGAGPQPSPGGASGSSDACMKGFVPLREEAEKRGKLIKAASERHAPPDEACKLIRNFGASEIKMIKYIETNAAKCGIPQQIGDQLKSGHVNTEKMQNQVCNVAQQAANQQRSATPSLSDVLGTSTALPEAQTAKKGGSTFDTLNGNVLTR